MKPNNFRLRSRLFPRHMSLCFGITASALFSSIALGASGTWTGTADAAWITEANWSAAPVPEIGNTATFNSAGNGNTTIDLGTGVTVGNIIFDTADAAAYTIGSGGIGAQTLTISGITGVQNIDVTATVATAQTINANIVSAISDNTMRFRNQSTQDLTINGTITGSTAGNKTLNVSTVAGGGAVIFNGAIGDSTANFILANTGAGTVILSGSGTSFLSTLRGTGGGFVIVDGQTITVAAQSDWQTGSTLEVRNGNLTFASNIRMNSNNDVNSIIVTDGKLAASGITQNGTRGVNVTLNGAGSLYLGSGGINVTNGTTTFTSGTLGANNNWSSSRAITLDGAADGSSLTIKTANEAGDAAFNITLSGILSGSGGFTKTGAGELILNGANTYTGTTIVHEGTMRLGSGASVVGPVTVNSGATVTGTGTISDQIQVNTGGLLILTETGTFSGPVTLNGGTLQGTGTIGGLLTAGSGGSIDLADGTIGEITLNSGLVLEAGSTLLFDYDLTTNTTDQIKVTGGTFSDASSVTVQLHTIGTGAAVESAHILISLVGTTGAVNASNYTLDTTNGDFDSQPVNLISIGGSLVLTVGNPVIGDGTVYWRNGTSGDWDPSNFSTDSAGVNAATGINTVTDVHFSATSPAPVATLTTLATDQAVKSLIIDSNQTDSVEIAGTQKLTIVSGIISHTGAGALTISNSELSLSSIQPWLNQSDNAITVSANITGTGTGLNLTGTSTGGFYFSGTNTYDAGTTINGGTLHLTGTGSLLSTGALTLAGTGGFDISALTNGGTTIGTLNGSATSQISLGTNTLTINQASSNNYAGIISGTTGGITKTGAGILTLSGANTYQGTTLINTGALNIQHDSALGTTDEGTTVASGAVLQIQGGINVGAETLTLGGTGIENGGALVNVSGDNTFGGQLTLSTDTRITSTAGTLTLNNTGDITGSGFNLTIGGAGHVILEGNIVTDAGGLTKEGAGNLTLTGTNTYSGPTTISAGGLNIGNQGTSGSLNPASNIVNNGTLRFQRTDEITQGVHFGTISGTGGVNHNSTGITNLNAVNTYTGTTLAGIAGGILRIAHSEALGSGGASNNRTQVNSGAALELTGGIAVANELLTLNGSGISDGGGLRSISGANSWGGAITQASASRINVDAGSSLNLTGNIGGAFALTLGGAGDITVSSVIGIGAGTLTKDGTGTLTLNGANTYTGATSINGGKLIVNGSLATGSAVTIGNSGILSGTGTIGGSVTTTSGGGSQIDLRDGSANGTLTVGQLNLHAGDILTFDLGTSSADKIAIASGGTYSFTDAGTATITLNAIETPNEGSYDLITNAAGINATQFTLSSIVVAGKGAFLDSSSGDSLKAVITDTFGDTAAYWNAASGSDWSTANFSANADGTGAVSLLGNNTKLYFSSTPA
ncbi:MAG: autotransporter-associated beta strand repeat-containing protein, partial [Luteolibacter sp.]